jgi:hypothetical protein
LRSKGFFGAAGGRRGEAIAATAAQRRKKFTLLPFEELQGFLISKGFGRFTGITHKNRDNEKDIKNLFL